MLAKYVGWGGLKTVFPDPGTGAFGKGMEDVGARLLELLTEDEYAAARRSIQYAHYTSETVISFMWRMAQTLGFTGGRVIEPGAGVGHFAGMMPGELIKGSTYFGIEMDPTTAAIAGQLYPHWTLRQQDYSRTAVPPDLFDLAIGNPPFANFRPADPKYDKHKFLLHDYFFAKTLDGVRPGGIMAFVTSAGTMNKQNAKARQYIADRADFIGAARLPNTAFKANAGTEVTTDVLFFRRRKSGAPENHVSPWVESVETDMPTRTGDTAKGYVNQYFIDNPEMVLGDPGLFDELVAGLRYSVRQRPGASLEADLTRAGARLIEQAPAVEAAPAGAAEGPGAIEMLTQEMKDGSYYLNDDGELLQFRMGAGRAPTRPGASGKLVKMSKKDQQMVRDLLPVRDAYREVLAADLGDDTDVADAARAKLNLNYDSFVDQYGPIRKTTTTWRKVKADELETLRQQARERARSLGDPWDEGMFDDALMVAEGASKAEIARARQAGREVAAASGRPFTEGSFDPDAVAAKPMTKMPNLQPFLGDPEAYRVMALEMGFDEDTGVAERSEVFERNIIRRQPEAKIETALDGMLHVLTTTGQFDIGAISAASNRSEQETWKELGDLTYHDPSLGEWMMAEEYLSGNVVLKLQQARAEALANPDYARNVGALEAVQPKKVGPGDIAVKVGSAWIPTEVYEAFATEVLQADFAQVTHNVELNLWNVEGYATQSGIAEYGAHNQVGGLIYGPTRIMQELLRAKILKAPRFRDADGSSHADTEGDIKVAEAIKHMQEAFGRWIWSNPARTESLVDLYNGKFNTTVEREYRTDYITTPGVADWWQWRNHQLRGIARIIVAGNTYLNHAVGSGKTSTMIAAAMELRRLGKVRKPLFVVPNHMLAQFGAEWYQLYPTANLMIADEANFHTSRRKRFVAEAGTGDYDAVIMTYDALGLVPISDTFAEGIIKEEIQKFVEGLTEVEDRFTRKRLEESIERLEKQLTRGARRKRDQVFTFEELGVDMLFTDEAQKYRKLGFSTAQGSVKGIDNTGGPTTMDFYIKTRYIESINPGRGLVFASGTPVTNTLSEIFSLQRFMDTPGLKEHGIEHFDAWASTFGAVEEEPERDVAGALKYVERFTGIPNAPELSRLVRSFMDVVTPEQLHEHVTVPAYRGGGREKVMIEQSGEQEWHHGTVVTRLEQAKTDKKFSEILKLINEARLAAIDPRLLPPGELLISDAEAGEAGAPEVGEGGRPVWSGRGSKLNQAIDNIYRIWQETTDQPFYTLDENGQYSDEPAFRGPATQIVFSPLGFTVEKGRLHLPTYMRQELMNRGIPGHQIAYMGDFKSHDKKKRLFNDMNEGKVRILIGSERNMGTGVNVQRRLAVEHNLAPVWFPADDEQRVGRILRQGNLNREVGVMDYSTVGSYDYAMWQMMSRKGRAIERFFRGDPELRFVGDIGEHAHYGQMMALTAEDPRLLQMVELQNELTKAEREKAASDDRVWNKRYAVKALDDRVQIAQQAEEHLDKAIAKRIDAEYKGDGWRMILGGRVIDDRAEAAQELSARWNAFVGRGIAKGEFNGDFGTFAGFNLVGSFMRFASGHIHNPQIALEMDGTLVIGRNLAEDEISDPGPLIVRSLSQRLAGLEKQRTEAQATNAAAGTERERLQADLDATPAVGWERVEELRAAHKQLETDIRAEAQTREAPAVDRPAAQPAPSINPMAEAMAEAHGVETIEAAGYVLRDGRMAAPPEGSTDALQTIRATDTAWVDTRSHIVRAEGPLSQVQMATIVEQLGGAPARLIHTKDGRELMNMQSKDGLTVETLRTAFPAPAPEVLQQGRVGAVQFDQAGKALIALTASADFDTLMEEMAHVFRRHLTGDQENAVAEWAGASLDAETGRWSWGRGAEEVFARGFVDWLREGVVPNDAVLSVFERARQWLRQIYAGVRSELNPQVRRVFEDMVLLHDYPEVQAFERAVGELEGMEKEALFTDGRQRRLRVQRSGRAYTVDAHDAEGRQLFMRQYGDIADAAREIAGVPTIENPTPAGSRDMRMERPDERAAREREAELRIASDDLQLQDMAAATGTAETQVLYQERGDEDPRRQQRLRNLAEGRKTQLLNRLAEMGVDPGDITPWNKKPLRELSMEDLRTVYQQMVQQRADGRQETARKYERRELVRYGRNRVRQIQASLQRILRDTKRMPAELRDPLRKLLTDLDLVRVGRTEAARMEVAEPETDPLRLLGTLQAAVAGAFDPEQRPPGTLEAQDIAGKRLAQLSVLELERLHNTIAYIGAEVAKAQAGLQAGYRKTANRVANEVVRDLRRAPPLRQNMAGRAVTHFLGERPGFLLERIGGGLDSTLYETLWKPIIKGAQNKRRLIRESAGRYHSDMRRAGMTMNRNQLAAWLRQRIDVPEWASEMHRWTRADLMSLALMWRDPYARRNLVDLRSDPAEIEAAPYTGGLVFTKHGRQSTDAVQVTQGQVLELIALLGEQERRFLGSPVRNMFNDLFRSVECHLPGEVRVRLGTGARLLPGRGRRDRGARLSGVRRRRRLLPRPGGAGIGRAVPRDDSVAHGRGEADGAAPGQHGNQPLPGPRGYLRGAGTAVDRGAAAHGAARRDGHHARPLGTGRAAGYQPLPAGHGGQRGGSGRP